MNKLFFVIAALAVASAASAAPNTNTSPKSHTQATALTPSSASTTGLYTPTAPAQYRQAYGDSRPTETRPFNTDRDVQATTKFSNNKR
ncbi:hypothetical protein [Paucibacter sp. DJ2R-2]|uniref:hypothetical protein n=1 Tax=Paucibacter sp. DJ2R-2 TaxID=2893558 RepID=UPI0021E4ED1D|nr:hypothetical protein [Paucibacter sp. DJ2R-2]MCV2441279.1 hypothetical protein [Paucibacter sp. DJ2R-2]